MINSVTVDEALKEIKKGKMLIIVDHPQRENEGDFYIPADKITSKHLMTMIRLGGGLVCCAITKSQAKNLSLPLMVKDKENNEKTKVSFTISSDAKKGTSTGASAFDRLKTIKVLANSTSKPADLLRPGHILGLIAKDGGVLERPGQTEAAVDLAKLANLNPSGVLCEILADNGHMANLDTLKKLSKKLNIKILTIDELIKFKRNGK